MRSLATLALACCCACLPAQFDELADAAPVTTIALPLTPAFALTVAADDEGRGRVLLSDGEALAWLRIDERAPQLRLATMKEMAELAELAGDAPASVTGLAVVDGSAVAEALVRFAATAERPDRLVRLRVADFSRPSPPALDVRVYPWVADPPPELLGPLAAVQLDDGLPEALSASDEGLLIWDALGTRAAEYEAARAAALDQDPDAFADDPSQGWGLTRCPELQPIALAGGRLLADARPAAVALTDATLTFIARVDATSSIGAPIHTCALAIIELPGPAETLAVVDLGHDGHDDLLVGAPALGEVWLFENSGEGLPPAPTRVLASDEPGEFGRSLAHVELGGEAPDLIVVGAPATRVDGVDEVGRVHLFDAASGEPLRTVEDLDPRAGSRHGLAVHGLDLPGREELAVSGARELRIHWTLLAGDPRP